MYSQDGSAVDAYPLAPSEYDAARETPEQRHRQAERDDAARRGEPLPPWGGTYRGDVRATAEPAQRNEQRGQVGEGHSPLPSFSSPVVWGWQHPARCLGQEQFLSDDGEDQAKALALCDACPVLAECQAYTRAAKPTFGVWAGRRYSFYGRPSR